MPATAEKRRSATKATTTVDHELEIASLREELAECQARLAEYDRLVESALDASRRAARGDLEARILNITDEGSFGEMLHGINHLLDMTDAFVRESCAALQFASEEKFFRRVLLRGMHGSFRHGAEQINRATNDLQGKTQALVDAREARVKLADEFEAAVKEIVDATAAAATELEATAGELARMADLTKDQSQVVTTAAGQANGSMQSVSDASDSLIQSVAQISSEGENVTLIAQSAAEGTERQQSRRWAGNERRPDQQRSCARHRRSPLKRETAVLNASIEAARGRRSGSRLRVAAESKPANHRRRNCGHRKSTLKPSAKPPATSRKHSTELERRSARSTKSRAPSASHSTISREQRGRLRVRSAGDPRPARRVWQYRHRQCGRRRHEQRSRSGYTIAARSLSELAETL